MALRVRFQYASGFGLGYSIERLSDGTYWDFSAVQAFSATPTTLVQPLPEGSGTTLGLYSSTLSTTPVAQFSNGQYAVRIHNTNQSNLVIGLADAIMYNGDDAPVFPSAGDPWAVTLPGAYATGQAGYLIGTYVSASTCPTVAQIATAVLTDAASSDLNTPGTLGYIAGHAPSWFISSTPPTASQIASAVWTDTTAADFSTAGSPGAAVTGNLDAKVSTRLAASSYVAPTTPPTPAQIATAVWADTTSTDFMAIGSPGAIVTGNLDAKVSTRLAASSYVAPTTPPTAAQIATAVLTDTTSTDLSTAGTLGFMVSHAPSWFTSASAPTAAQIATAVWTDTTSTDFATAGSPGAALTGNLDAKVSTRLAASSYVAPTTPPTAAQIATAVLTDTTSTDLSTAGTLGYIVSHAPSWFTSTTAPTAAQIATAVLTDTTAADLSTSGSLGFMVSHAPSWFTSASAPTAAQIATAVWTDTTSTDFATAGSPGAALTGNLDAKVSTRLAASSYVAPTTPPTAAQIATAVLTDTTSTDLSTAGTLGYIVSHAPSWFTSTTAPTASQIATAVLTDTTTADLSTTGSLGYIVSHAPSWFTSSSAPTAAQIATAVWTDTTSTDFATSGSPGATIASNLDAKVSSRSTYSGGAVASVTAPVQVDFTQTVPLTNSPNSVGDCLNAARAEGFGKWVLSGETLQLYAPDGVTIVRTFQLDNSAAPSQRV